MCFALRATSGLPLDRSKGKPLTRAENLHCRAAFSAVSFCNGVAKTVEKRKNSKQSHRADDQAKRWEKALHGTHCVALGEGTIRHTLCGVGRRHYKAHTVCLKKMVYVLYYNLRIFPELTMSGI